MRTIFCEKHSLAKTVSAALGAGTRIANPSDKFSAHWEFDWNGEKTVIVHGSGHLAGLAKPEFYDEKLKFWSFDNYPFLPSKFEVVPNENTIKLLQYVEKYLRNADVIINCCDPDREGELIFQYLLEVLKINKPWQRVLLPDLTENTVVKAFSNLKSAEEMRPLALAGRARSAADWLYGMNLTAAATLKFGNHKSVMNIGRVMTATLNMICERENAVKNHIKTPFWKLVFESDNVVFESEKGKIFDKNIAEKLLQNVENRTAVVNNISTKNRTENAPLLYNSTGLQAACANILNFDLKKTAEIMQKLYEKGLITYPRTSSEHLPEEMKEEVKFTLERLFLLPKYAKFKPLTIAEFTKRHFDNTKVGSHTAIIPTANRADNLSEDEEKVYDLVAKSVLRLAFSKAEYEDTEIEIIANGEVLKSKKSIQIKDGWRVFDGKKKEDILTKSFEKNAVLNGVFSLVEGATEPPKRFTEASLILAMETCGQQFSDEETRELMKREKKGLGTDATRVETVQKLLNTGFIAQKGKSLMPTEKGDFLISHIKSDRLKSAEMTGEMEKKLSQIAENSIDCERLFSDFMGETEHNVKEIFAEIKNSKSEKFTKGEDKSKVINCPFCGCEMRSGKKNFYCSGYYSEPKCNFVIWREMFGKTVTENVVKLLCNSGKTGVINGFKSKNDKEYSGVLVLNKITKKVEMSFEK